MTEPPYDKYAADQHQQYDKGDNQLDDGLAGARSGTTRTCRRGSTGEALTSPHAGACRRLGLYVPAHSG